MEGRVTLALIDASGYLYRAFHAIRPLSAPDGRPTNAVFGFAAMLRKFLASRHPGACAVAFDRKEKTFRHEMDETYKAQRAPMPDDLVPQIEDAKRLCRAWGLAVVEAPGFEADDLIGTLAVRGAAAGLRVEIASADKDLFQLVSGGDVVVWHPVKEALLDATGVRELFGAPPERVIDVLALMGDASDNIPGVSGIGEKGARELVSAFGSLEGIYARLDDVKGRKRECLEKGRDDAFRSRALATVRRDSPVPGGVTREALLEAFALRPWDDEAQRRLGAFFDEMGFSRMKREMLGAEGSMPSAAIPFSTKVDTTGSTTGTPPPSGAVAAVWLTESSALSALVSRARSAGRIGLHLESAPGRVFPAIPLAAALALPDGEVAAFPLDGPGAASGRSALGELIGSPDLILSLHEAKRLFLAARVLGLEPPAGFFDAMLAAYVEGPGLWAHDLASDARHLLGDAGALPTPKDVTGAAAFESTAPLASAAGLTYLGAHASAVFALGEKLRGGLGSPGGEARARLLREIEFPLVPVLARMEWEGIAVDRQALAGLGSDFERRLADLERRIHAAAGEPFNVASPPQLGRILFERLGYPVLKKTRKTKAYATGSDVLEELAARGAGPLPALVLEWRELAKLQGTYVEALPLRIAADGRIHTRFDQAVAATGRLSSNDPNLQNIPVRTEAGRAIRRAFVAPAGRVLLSADYSQIELRLLAHLSLDPDLVETFRRGEDIHRATAAKVFGIHPGLVSPDQRRGAKTINFGILYGMGPFALAAQLGVPQPQARAFIAAYFDRFPGIRRCLDAIVEKARLTGGTETIFGRVRPIPGLLDRNHAVRANAERMAMNAPFQGSAADLVKVAMIRLDAALAAEIPSSRILLQVHDELLVECDEGDADQVSTVAKEAMERAAKLIVPMTVEVGRGGNWADAK